MIGDFPPAIATIDPVARATGEKRREASLPDVFIELSRNGGLRATMIPY
jgi:hypothetical protein